MRVGIAQLNPVVGDLDGNFCLAVDAYEQLTGQGADFVVFPELVLCGYPPRDLLFKINSFPTYPINLRNLPTKPAPLQH